jgi:hypothetical protein
MLGFSLGFVVELLATYPTYFVGHNKPPLTVGPIGHYGTEMTPWGSRPGLVSHIPKVHQSFPSSSCSPQLLTPLARDRDLDLDWDLFEERRTGLFHGGLRTFGNLFGEVFFTLHDEFVVDAVYELGIEIL